MILLNELKTKLVYVQKLLILYIEKTFVSLRSPYLISLFKETVRNWISHLDPFFVFDF